MAGVVSTLVLKLWLRVIYAAVPATYATLSAGLLAVGTAKINATSSGEIMVTAGNGHSITFSSGESEFTPGNFASGISKLLDDYDSARADLVSSGVTTPTDAQIYAEMMARLVPVRELTKDFSQMNWRSGG